MVDTWMQFDTFKIEDIECDLVRIDRNPIGTNLDR